LILTSDRLEDTILDMVGEELRAMVMSHTAGDPIEWDLPGLVQAVRTILPLPENFRPQWKDLNPEQIEEQLLDLAEQTYEAKEQRLGSEMMHQLERLLMLHVVDNLWVKHLTALDELREGIGLRAFGQRDPLVEYKREAFDMFDELKSSIAHDTARRIYFANLVREPARREMRAQRPGAEPQRAAATHSASKEAIGRNDPCPCGSGRKYKNCCMRKEQSAGSRQQAASQATAGEPGPTHKHHGKKKRR
jgi:preprotein translocase subunit SecA